MKNTILGSVKFLCLWIVLVLIDQYCNDSKLCLLLIIEMVSGAWMLTGAVVLISLILFSRVYPLKSGKVVIPLSWCSKTPLKEAVKKFKRSLIGFAVCLCLSLSGPLTRFEIYFFFNFTDLRWITIFTLWCFSLSALLMAKALFSGFLLRMTFSQSALN